MMATETTGTFMAAVFMTHRIVVQSKTTALRITVLREVVVSTCKTVQQFPTALYLITLPGTMVVAYLCMAIMHFSDSV